MGCGHIAGPTTCSGTLACAAAGTYKQSMCCIAIRGPGTGLVTVPICTAPPCQCSRVSNGSLRPLLTGSLSEPCKDSCTRVLSIEEGQGGGGGGGRWNADKPYAGLQTCSSTEALCTRAASRDTVCSSQ